MNFFVLSTHMHSIRKAILAVLLIAAGNMAITTSAFADQTEEVKKLVASAPVAEASAEKAINGMPYCTDLKVFTEQCILNTAQIFHMLNGQTIKGPQVGYEITQFTFSKSSQPAESAHLNTNGRTGGKWRAESNFLLVVNHWNPQQEVKQFVYFESQNTFGFMGRNKSAWYSWK